MVEGLGKIKLLLVDDEPINLLVLRVLLEQAGYEVFEAGSGEQAREILQTLRPDLILLDVMMPGESGLETCQRLRQNPKLADIPVIFLSSLDQVDTKVAGLNSGAVDYISKPFHAAEVVARIRSHLMAAARQQTIIRSQSQRLGQVHRAQQAMLVHPQSLPQAHFAVEFVPVLEAGGDFYDVVQLGPDLFGYLVADVSGHDLGASFLTSSLKALFHQNAQANELPGRTLVRINEVLCNITPPGTFLTAIYALLDRRAGKLQIASAGHPAPILVPAGTIQARYFPADGDIIGAFREIEPGEIQLEVSAGDRLYLYTDGLVDKSGVALESSGLLESCALVARLPLEEAVQGVVARSRAAQANGDDTLFLGVEV